MSHWFRLASAARGPRASTALVLATLTYLAVAVNLSWIQTWHNSDSVIPGLISIEKYTPFYWSENRFGMLVPLLASPVRDYGWNLLVQSQLIIFAGLGTVFLVDRLAGVQAGGRAIRITVVALLLFAFYKPVSILVFLLPGSPYLVGLFLLLAALYLLLDSRPPAQLRWPIACLLLLFAFWVNVSNLVIAAVTVAVWPPTKELSLRVRAAILLAVVVSAAAILAGSSFFPGSDFRKLLPLAAWPASLRRILANLPVIMHAVAAAVVICTGAIVAAVRFRHGKYSPVHALAVAAASQIGVTAGSDWVARNAHEARYIAGPVLILLTLSLLILAAPLAAGIERAAGATATTVLACALCVAAVTTVFGAPSPEQAIRHIDTATADIPAPPEELSCTHVIGNYWYVWETVFHNRMRGGKAKIWGVSHRSDMTRETWSAIPVDQRRYCGLCSDAQIEHMRVREGVGPLTKEAEFSGVCIFREQPK